MALDSKAVFAMKLKKLNLEDSLNDFIRLGWDTLGKFAFSANYIPGKADDSAFVSDVVVPLFQNDNPPQKAALRRLFYEAFALNAAEMIRVTSQPDDEDKPRKLPAPERAARFEALKEKLEPGLKLQGELEPSNESVDKLVSMRDTGVLRYLRWEELTKREQELKGVKKDEFWKEKHDGTLQRTYRAAELSADIQDLLRLKYALQRRGAALEMSRLMSFKEHELLVEFLFGELTRDPMEDHYPVTLNQVKEADLQVFKRLGEMTRAGFDGVPDDELPLDVLLPKVILEPRIAQLLFQRQKPVGKAEPFESGNKRSNDDELERLRRENKKLKSETGKGGNKGKNHGQGNYGQGQGSGKGDNGKGKGKGDRGGGGKGGRDGGSMPRELIGMAQKDRGKNLCYDYNIKKKCPVKGDRCTLGEHLCAFPGCGDRHSLQDCRQWKKQQGF